MKWKQVCGLVLIILIVMLAVFFYKFNSPLAGIEEDLITYFEKKSNLNIEYKEISCWPINKITIKGLKLSSNDKMLISIPEVMIFYDIKEIINEPGNWFDSVEYLSIEEPDIFIKDINLFRNGENNIFEFNRLISEIGVEINKGHICLSDDNNKFDVNNIQAYLKNNVLEIDARANLKKISFSGYSLENLKINNLTGAIDLAEEIWQGTLMTDTFTLTILEEFFPETENLISKGTGQALVNFKGFKSKLRDYRAKITVDNGVLNIEQPGFLKDGEINNINGEIYFNSDEKDLKFSDFDFTYSNNNYNFNGILAVASRQVPEIKGQLTSDNLELSDCGFVLPEFKQLKLAGKASLNMFVDGKISSPEMDLDIHLSEGKIGEELITDFDTYLRYSNKSLYVDSFNLRLNRGSTLNFRGLYNIDSKLYSFTGSGANVDTTLIKKYIPSELPAENFDGKLRFDLIVNGKGLNFAKLNARGSMGLQAPEIGHSNYEQLKSRIWLADRVLMFTDGLLEFAGGDINFSGELNLANNEVDLEFKGKNIDAGLIGDFIQKDFQFSANKLNFTGNVVNTIDSPEFNIDLLLPAGKINKMDFRNFRAQAIYKKEKIDINKLSFDSCNGRITGSAELDLAADNPGLSANLNIADIDCRRVLENLEISLPLRGNIDRADLSIRGSFAAPVIQGTASSGKIFLNINENEYSFSDPDISFSWQEDRSLVINELRAKQDDTELFLEGEILENWLDLDFTIDKFKISTLDLTENINARLNLAGTVTGNMKSPAVTGNITAEDIVINEQNLKDLKGKFSYCNNNIELKEIKWDTGHGKYYIEGIINDIFTDTTNTDLKIITRDGKLEQLMELVDYKFPFQQNYLIDGNAEIIGYLNELKTVVSVEARAANNSENCINLKGEIGKKLDLEIRGEKVKIADKYKIYPDLDLAFEASVDFKGKIGGTFDKFYVNMQTEASNVEINEKMIDKITGSVNIEKENEIELRQIITANNSELEINGKMNFGDKPELDLGIDTREFPLEILTGVLLPPRLGVSGYLDGKININGNPEDLNANGKIYLAGKDIELDPGEKINSVRGEIIFEGKEIELNNLVVYYASQPIEIRGKLHPFNGQDFWDINVSGKNLPYDSGSINGSFDPEIWIGGSFENPEISGELMTHNLIIDIPFNFQNNIQDSLFKPVLDLVLKPGEDVYIRNQYLDILVEEGSLQLTNEGNNYFLEGRVDSRQGSFDYYNNKFIMEKGYANFRRFNDNIPEIFASAYTYVKGVKIYININGPANNMLMTFYSEPELSRKEIIELLVSKGGLGELTSESEASITEFLKKEIARFFRESFQLEFIENLEENFKTIFELDRMEIDTYQLGFSEDVSVYLGKKISDKFYLQYKRTFNLDDTVKSKEIDEELSFNYYLNDKTHLEGSWLGEDDFSLSVKTEIKF